MPELMISSERWLMNYLRVHAGGITLETGVSRRVRFRSCGTVGYGPTMWVKIRKGVDILHCHDSKSCERITGQLCWLHCWYQGRGTKRTIFLLVERGGPIRQSSRPAVVTGMSSTKVTGSYWQNCTTRCLHKRKILLLRSYRSQERLNQQWKENMIIRLNRTMERKICLNTYFEGISFPRTSRARYPWQDIK